MPFQSSAQARLFFAAAAGRARKGPSPAVAKKFIADTHGQKLGKLPNHVRAKIGKPATKSYSMKGRTEL